jgi:hypothetical protein
LGVANGLTVLVMATGDSIPQKHHKNIFIAEQSMACLMFVIISDHSHAHRNNLKTPE